jgi:hypothetical protein
MQLLKMIIQPITADIEKIIDNVQMELDCIDTSARAVQVRSLSLSTENDFDLCFFLVC